MAKEPKHIEISRMPELVKLVHEVRSTNEPTILREERQDVAMLTPIKPVVTRSVRGTPVTPDDPLFKLVGIGHSGKGDVSANTHTYLADASLHHPQG
jgi:hypothetical protein